MHEPLTSVLALAAVTVGALHTVAPDHWVPFAALARAQGWSATKTARITAMCGFGHVTVSVLLGTLALGLGVGMLEVVGRRMESIAGVLLIAFGCIYGAIGLRRVVAPRLADVHAHAGGHVHTHRHGLGRHVHGGETGRSLTPWALFLLFSADPCVAVIPIMFAAAPLGVARTLVVVSAYEAATIATMVVLVISAAAAVSRVQSSWLNRYSDAAAGAVIAIVGIVVAALGW
jgi:putative Mn2+ efflux pump MntP